MSLPTSLFERQLALRIALPGGVEEWDELAGQDYLGRLLRTLGDGLDEWDWEVVTVADAARFGWDAYADRHDRAQRVTLLTPAVDERPASAPLFTLTVSCAPLATPRTGWGGEWLVGGGLAFACWLVARQRMDPLWAQAAAMAVLLGCGLGLPRALRHAPRVQAGVDPTDGELLERLHAGARQFASFEVLSPDWQPARRD